MISYFRQLVGLVEGAVRAKQRPIHSFLSLPLALPALFLPQGGHSYMEIEVIFRGSLHV